MKSYLFLLRKPAHSGSYVQEILDVILTTAAFDQQVTLLIMDAGQITNSNGMKDIAAIYNALELYDITEIYTEEDSLHERGLKLADLCLPLKSINRNEVSAFIEGFDVVFSG